jgi:putative transposase
VAEVGDLGYKFAMPLRPHLRRLDEVWIDEPIYFVTITTKDRRPVLACQEAFTILVSEFRNAPTRHGWTVERFVVMPDQFICSAPKAAIAPPVSLSDFVGRMKQWSAKAILRALGLAPPLWQTEFFDHVLRSNESYESKWRYVVENPVRAGLARLVEDWPARSQR